MKLQALIRESDDQLTFNKILSHDKQKYEQITPSSQAPTVKPGLTRYSGANITKIISNDVTEFLRSRRLDGVIGRWSVDVDNNVNRSGQLELQLQIYVAPVTQIDYKDPSSKFTSKIIDVVRVKIAELVVQAFGNLVSAITPHMLGPIITTTISKKSKPSLETLVGDILRKRNVTSFGLFTVTKTKTGYRAKVEGTKLPTSWELQQLRLDMKAAFGELFVDIKHMGEVTSIGHRPVPAGTTNIVILFTTDLLSKYKAT